LKKYDGKLKLSCGKATFNIYSHTILCTITTLKDIVEYRWAFTI